MNLQVTARGEAVTAVNLQVTARGEAVTAVNLQVTTGNPHGIIGDRAVTAVELHCRLQCDCHKDFFIM